MTSTAESRIEKRFSGPSVFRRARIARAPAPAARPGERGCGAVLEIDTNKPVAQDVAIVLYDSFAQPEAGGDELADIVANERTGPNTVKSYIRALYRKIGVTSRSQALLWGVNHGFAPDFHRIQSWRVTM